MVEEEASRIRNRLLGTLNQFENVAAIVALTVPHAAYLPMPWTSAP